MKRTSLSSFVFSLLAVVAAPSLASAQTNNPSAAERFAKPSDTLTAAENRYWQRTPLPVPADVILEVGGIVAVPPARLLVTTRRGEVWWIDGAYDADPKPRYTLFAQGLHEPLGIIAAPNGGYYVAQRQELTRLVDTDNDGRADVFETVAKFPISGSYHEYAFGPVLAPNGNLRVTLNVAFGGATQSPVPWRGWMVEVTPDGQLTPIASGLRSPAGLVVSSRGAWFTTDNQGEWVGSGKITHIESGDFIGHPAGLAWSRLPGSTVSVRPEQISDFEQPMHVVAKKLPGLKSPAVWLPHAVLGISNSAIIEDLTAGKFGPFAGQFFVGDQGQSKLMRISLEQVQGVWQGAAYAFREGFESGTMRMTFGENATMFVGETARGWGSVGPKQYGIERVTWTGQTPFEIKEVKAQPDGFLLTFTAPVDRTTAENPASYSIAGFTYNYHAAYGAAPIDRLVCPVRKVVVAADGLSVRLAAVCLREGYVHEIKVNGVRSAAGGSAVLHPTAYYTLNRFAPGDRIIPIEPNAAEICAAAVPAVALGHTAKHPIKQPTDWPNSEGDQQFLLGTQPGLKFDQTLLTTKAGTRIRLIFKNTDDMLHNFVLCAPGKGQDVGMAALALGIDGASKSYVPDTADVLYHTSLVQPETSDTIYFIAPSTPGDYDFICSFPGHAALMKGILRVEAK